MHEGKDFSAVKKRRTGIKTAGRLGLVEEKSTDLSEIHNSVRQGLIIAAFPNNVSFALDPRKQTDRGVISTVLVFYSYYVFILP